MDRNLDAVAAANVGAKSLSARRAWIEIYRSSRCAAGIWSLSARRAWIEITKS